MVKRHTYKSKSKVTYLMGITYYEAEVTSAMMQYAIFCGDDMTINEKTALSYIQFGSAMIS